MHYQMILQMILKIAFTKNSCRGNLYFDFCDFVFDLMYNIIQFQVNINLGDPVMKITLISESFC